jgi:biotin-dependent carboxylase-like uncharacterized protein
VVGNAREAGAIEMLYQGATFEVEGPGVRIAVGGAARLDIGSEEQVRSVASLTSTTVHGGDTVKVVITGPSIAAYLAVSGGLAIAPVLGSVATYVRAGLGGLQGRRLQVGDRVPLQASAPSRGPEVMLRLPPLLPASQARVVLGPQDDAFDAAALRLFTEVEWRVLPASDRMGLRLDGPPVRARRGHDIASDGIAPGAIQVPADGRPIVLLADRQTTGGYVKIATVASVDLPAVGRLAPGMPVRFEPIDVATAEAARRALDLEIAGWPDRLSIVPSGTPDTARLLDANLIDGVVNAHGLSD